MAKQRGSKIRWDGVDAEQPPPYFDYVFQLSKWKTTKTNSATTLSAEESSVISSSMESMLSDETSVVDVAYLDISLKKIGLYDAGTSADSGDDDKDVDDDFQRRKRSHAERLSNSSYTREQLFSDLGSDSD